MVQLAQEEDKTYVVQYICFFLQEKKIGRETYVVARRENTITQKDASQKPRSIARRTCHFCRVLNSLFPIRIGDASSISPKSALFTHS